MTKAELLKQAKRLGLNVTEENTVEEITEALDSVEDPEKTAAAVAKKKKAAAAKKKAAEAAENPNKGKVFNGSEWCTPKELETDASEGKEWNGSEWVDKAGE